MIRCRGLSLLPGMLLLAGCEPGLVDDEADEVAEHEEQMAAIEEDNARLETTNTRLRERVAQLEDEAAGFSQHLATLEERILEAPPPTLPVGTVEGLDDALRAYLPEPGSMWLPGVTRWRDEHDLDLPADLAAESPGQLTLLLVDEVVDATEFGGAGEFPLPWEVTARVLRIAEAEAVAIVQQWGGLGDDSVSGFDYRFTLRRGAVGWVVAEVSQREQCTRNNALPGEDDLPEFCV